MYWRYSNQRAMKSIIGTEGNGLFVIEDNEVKSHLNSRKWFK